MPAEITCISAEPEIYEVRIQHGQAAHLLQAQGKSLLQGHALSEECLAKPADLWCVGFLCVGPRLHRPAIPWRLHDMWSAVPRASLTRASIRRSHTWESQAQQRPTQRQGPAKCSVPHPPQPRSHQRCAAGRPAEPVRRTPVGNSAQDGVALRRCSSQGKRCTCSMCCMQWQ